MEMLQTGFLAPLFFSSSLLAPFSLPCLSPSSFAEGLFTSHVHQSISLLDPCFSDYYSRLFYSLLTLGFVGAGP